LNCSRTHLKIKIRKSKTYETARALPASSYHCCENINDDPEDIDLSGVFILKCGQFEYVSGRILEGIE